MEEGLNVPSDLGLPDEQQQQLEDYWDTYPEIYQNLELMGFGELPKPQCPQPQLTPEDYVNLEGDAYTIKQAQVDLWMGYAVDTRARLEAQILQRTNAMKDMLTMGKLAIKERYPDPKKRPNETTIKEEVMAHPHYRQLLNEQQKLEQALKVVEARVSYYERLAGGLSRQITFRGQNIDVGGKAVRRVRQFSG